MFTGSLAPAIGSLLIAQSATPAPSAGGAGSGLMPPRGDAADIAAWAAHTGAEWGLRVLGVVIVLVGAWFVGAWARRVVYRPLNRPQFDQTLVRFLSNLVRYAILVLGLIAALTIFGIAPTSLAAVVGATGLAIGLALQGSLSNLAAGIMLLLLRPYKVGDVVTVAGQTGKIDDIELFNTKLDTFDNRRVILPNGQIFGAVIENVTHHATRRVDITVGVRYAADVDATRQALIRALGAIPGVLADPAPDVVLLGLGPSSVDWQVQAWVRTDDFGPVRQASLRAIKIALDEAGISVPFPQMEILTRGRAASPQPLGDGVESRLPLPPAGWPQPTYQRPNPPENPQT